MSRGRRWPTGARRESAAPGSTPSGKGSKRATVAPSPSSPPTSSDASTASAPTTSRRASPRTSVALPALSGVPAICVFTHASVGLGEDGPPHQPVEQLASLRAIPNLTVIRPADPTEAVEAWRVAVRHRHGPVALVLTRQTVPVIDRSKYAPASGLRHGAYVLAEPPAGKP